MLPNAGEGSGVLGMIPEDQDRHQRPAAVDRQQACTHRHLLAVERQADRHAVVRVGVLPAVHREHLGLVGELALGLDAVLVIAAEHLLELPAAEQAGYADEVVQGVQLKLEVHLLCQGLGLIHGYVPSGPFLGPRRVNAASDMRFGTAIYNYFISA
ncbi:MAG: hypothetical protein E6J91_12855 [Deltaproteobacteria bacterium]|nr:MAG: hypothetical protein E6J91_12855 [Deltaproteobacteria bacterium]